jgi:hypothetical protein
VTAPGVEVQFGLLALSIGQRLPLQVCRSAAGFYVGTLDAEGLPVSRESVEYWRRSEAAADAFRQGHWTQRREP